MKKKLVVVVCFILIFSCVQSICAQANYSIDVTKVQTSVMRGHLNLGGRNLQGDSIGVTSFYLERNGQPFIPVIGEFHFSRYPNQYWNEELQKMKAGGITTVATYIFWNMHEFKEGVFDWSGDLDVRRFTELCAQNGLSVLMRIGPFAHGEMRNGGLPDWLYGRPIDVRSNDKTYLFYANRLYQEIGKQLKGMMFKDGGPVIGVQLENEYQHSSGPWGFTYQDAPSERTVAGRDRKINQVGVGINDQGNEFADVGRDHMKTLKQLAIKAGLVAPIYTATGWGFATIVENGSIPVMAGYAYPFWVPGNKPSPFYLFKNIQQKPDYAPVSYDVNLYPSMAAELGTGMAVTYSRRPRVPGESFLPLMVRTVGSGTNGLGYYMYHGGTTPSIGNFFMAEGAGLQNKSYDYQAPIGEYGLTSSGFYSLKRINQFLKSFGNDLAPLYPVIPVTNDSIKSEDTRTLRYSVRSDGNKGYLFLQNFQDHVIMSDLNDLKINIATKSGNISFPETGAFTLKAGLSAIFPFNVTYDGLALRMSTVQPYCRFSNDHKPYYVMTSIDGIAPEMVFKGNVKATGTGIRVFKRNGNTVVSLAAGARCEFQAKGVSFLILPAQDTEHAYLIGKAGAEHVVISEALVLEDQSELTLLSKNESQFDMAVYPTCGTISSPDATEILSKPTIQHLGEWSVGVSKEEPTLKLLQADNAHFVLKAGSVDLSKLNDLFITFDYRGDRGICMMNGELQTDDLYTSKPWTIGLKRYQQALKTNDMYFYFVPMQKDAPYLSYLDKEVVPDFSKQKSFLEVKQPTVTVEYKVTIKLLDLKPIGDK
jgi:hypothetical protein